MATTSAQVQQLYVGLLGRAADQTGLNYWLNELNATPAKMTLENLRANIVNSQPEYKAIFGSLSRVDTVTKIYSNLFGRAPDAAGLTYWTTGGGSTVNIDQLTLAFINGASTDDTKALTNKVVVSEVYTSTVGANFVAADAAAIVAVVNKDPASVTTGIGKLTDGSLSGIAIPTGVSQLKAQEAAAKAQSDYQTAKVTELTKLSVDLTAAGQTIKADNGTVTTVTPAASGTIDAKFNAMATAIGTEINDARLLIGDGNGTPGSVVTTANLQINADAKAKTLADATTALKAANAGYIDKVTAYQAAVKNFSTAVDANGTAVAVAKGSVANLVVNATADQKGALVTALNESGLFAPAFTAADFAAGTVAAAVDKIYTAVSGTGATVNALAGVETALSNYGYSSLKPLATQHKDYVAKQTAVTDAANSLKAVSAVTADDDLETAYIDAVAPAAVAAKAVVDSKAIDALAATLKAAVDGNDALTGAVTGIKVGSNVVELTAVNLGGAGLNADTAGGDSDVFHFGTTGITAAKDGIITNAGSLGTVKGTDAIYVGNDYVKGAGTATATGGITGGNDTAKEVFFFQKGNDTYVVLETKAYGSNTVTNFTDVATPGSTPDAAVIQLTGVGIEKVSFANGVVSVA